MTELDKIELELARIESKPDKIRSILNGMVLNGASLLTRERFNLDDTFMFHLIRQNFYLIIDFYIDLEIDKKGEITANSYQLVQLIMRLKDEIRNAKGIKKDE